jgi:hypothetical protein
LTTSKELLEVYLEKVLPLDGFSESTRLIPEEKEVFNNLCLLIFGWK